MGAAAAGSAVNVGTFPDGLSAGPAKPFDGTPDIRETLSARLSWCLLKS
jgi:hypothetical protein